MSLNLDCALTRERISRNTMSDIICDPDTWFILNNVNQYSASKTAQAFYCKYLLTLLTYECVEANSVDLDQEQSDWVHFVCVYLH